MKLDSNKNEKQDEADTAQNSCENRILQSHYISIYGMNIQD